MLHVPFRLLAPQCGKVVYKFIMGSFFSHAVRRTKEMQPKSCGIAKQCQIMSKLGYIEGQHPYSCTSRVLRSAKINNVTTYRSHFKDRTSSSVLFVPHWEIHFNRKQGSWECPHFVTPLSCFSILYAFCAGTQMRQNTIALCSHKLVKTKEKACYWN